MYGSHDSLTGYPVRKWWMKIFQPFSKTQSLSIYEQIKAGVEVFDIRVRVGKDNELIACHGLVEYKVHMHQVFLALQANQRPYRLILENKLGGRKCTDEHLEYLYQTFLNKAHYRWCWYVSDKKHWRTKYNPIFHPDFPSIPLGEKNCTGKIIPAWTHNFCNPSKEYAKYNYSKKVYWYDFIHKT